MRLIVSLILLVFVVSCAQISPLAGGDKDNYAPTIDSSKTYPLNGALNFNENEIVIKFNEFIKLNNVNDNIIITPQLKEKPTISSKNKTFSLIFNENLAENTTYVINFNGAIQDITEKNDSVFQYVFSTGSYIDSLALSGTVRDSYTNKPVDNCFIAIYPATNLVQFDSIPFNLKPTYIGQTNKSGEYAVNYLKDGEYAVFAFTDKNKNMQFDPDDEQIGFLSEGTILINENKKDVDFRLFSMVADKILMTKSEFTYPGKLEIVFNRTPEKFNIRSNVEIVDEGIDSNDSLIYWVSERPTNKVSFYITINDNPIDTLTPYLKDQPKDDKLEKLIIKSNVQSGNLLLPSENLEISVKEPVLNVNTDMFHFYTADSIEIDIDHQVNNLKTITFYTFETDAKYVQIDSLAIESFYGNFNHDKPIISFENRLAEDYFGKLILNVDSLDSTHVFELLDEKQNVIQTKTVTHDNEIVTFDDVPPGKYQLRAIADSNEDGEWSEGSIVDKTQAEKVSYYTDEIKIRSKWDLEIEWVLGKN